MVTKPPPPKPKAAPRPTVAGPTVQEGTSPLQPDAPPTPPASAPAASAQADKAASILGSADAPGGAPGAPGAEAAPAPPPALTPEAVVGLVELANMIAVRAVASQRKVAHDERLAALYKLDPETRETLKAYAPYAMPYLEELLARGPLVGALIFGGVAVVTIATNLGRVKELSPAKPAASSPQSPAPGIPPTPQPESRDPYAAANMQTSAL